MKDYDTKTAVSIPAYRHAPTEVAVEKHYRTEKYGVTVEFSDAKPAYIWYDDLEAAPTKTAEAIADYYGIIWDFPTSEEWRYAAEYDEQVHAFAVPREWSKKELKSPAVRAARSQAERSAQGYTRLAELEVLTRVEEGPQWFPWKIVDIMRGAAFEPAYATVGPDRYLRVLDRTENTLTYYKKRQGSRNLLQPVILYSG